MDGEADDGERGVGVVDRVDAGARQAVSAAEPGHGSSPEGSAG